jgi:hypothetical protein
MKASKRAVNWFMRLRRSSKPKLIDGSWSAMDGASCEEARIVVLMEGSKVVMVRLWDYLARVVILSSLRECAVVLVHMFRMRLR